MEMEKNILIRLVKLVIQRQRVAVGREYGGYLFPRFHEALDVALRRVLNAVDEQRDFSCPAVQSLRSDECKR